MVKMLFRPACPSKDWSARIFIGTMFRNIRQVQFHGLCVSHKAYHLNLKMIKRVGTDKWLLTKGFESHLFRRFLTRTWLNGNRYKGRIISLSLLSLDLYIYIYREISISDREIRESDGNSRIDYSPVLKSFM